MVLVLSFLAISSWVALPGFSSLATEQHSSARRSTAHDPLHSPEPSASDESTRARVSEDFGKLPLSFEPNCGQVDDQVGFISRGCGYNLFLTATDAVIAFSEEGRTGARGNDNYDSVSSSIPDASARGFRMRLLGANPNAKLRGLDELPGRINYLMGNDPKKWRTDVPTYAKTQSEQVYDGVDIVYYGDQRRLEYDFQVAPGADYKAISLKFESFVRSNDGSVDWKQGDEQVRVDADGDLVFQTSDRDVRQPKPVIYQVVDGARQEVSGGYMMMNDQRVGFQVGSYDATLPLIIDPFLAYSTYLGGSDIDWGADVAIDAAGNIYVTGSTASTDFPLANPIQSANSGGYEVFVTKLKADGSTVIFSTYLGGNGGDTSAGIAFRPGSVYITGGTTSTDFPITFQAVQTANNGGPNAFVTRLTHSGSLVYSTYLGGDYAYAEAIAVDQKTGDAYVVGTAAGTFPTVNALQPVYMGAGDGFIAKLNPSGSALYYSTYLGGSSAEYAFGVAVDSSGNAYVAGETSSTDFPTVNPFQANYGGGPFLPYYGHGPFDAFVAKLNPSGSALLYSTYLGGSGHDSATGLKVHNGRAFIVGTTESNNFPTANPFQPTLAGPRDIFVAKLSLSGSALVYSTYLGGSGSGTEQGNDIAVDSSGSAYVVGFTGSSDFPLANSLQSLNGPSDAFITKFDFTGAMIEFSTLLGGSATDYGWGLALDGAGNIYIAGQTSSTNFPTLSPYQPALSGVSDAFITKIQQ